MQPITLGCWPLADTRRYFGDTLDSNLMRNLGKMERQTSDSTLTRWHEGAMHHGSRYHTTSDVTLLSAKFQGNVPYESRN